MDAITLWQPYATCIRVGLKDIETRDWLPPIKIIGHDLAIHASKQYVPGYRLDPALRDALRHYWGSAYDIGWPLGKVVAVARLIAGLRVIEPPKGIIREGYVYTQGWALQDTLLMFDDSITGKRDGLVYGQTIIPPDVYGDFSVGRALWVLDNIRSVDPPVAARGRQRLWQLDDALLGDSTLEQVFT